MSVKYQLEPSKPVPEPVTITLTMEQYYGGMFPTIRANGVALAHFLDDGRLCIRETIRGVDAINLTCSGLKLRSSNQGLDQYCIETVNTEDLCQGRPPSGR